MTVMPFTKLDLPVKLFLFTCLGYTWQEVARVKVKSIVYRYWFRKCCHKDMKRGMITLIFSYIIRVYLMQSCVTSETVKLM